MNETATAYMSQLAELPQDIREQLSAFLIANGIDALTVTEVVGAYGRWAVIYGNDSMEVFAEDKEQA